MTRRTIARAVALLALALAAATALAAPALAAEPATLRLLGSSPTYDRAIDIHTAAGPTIKVRPSRYHYRITRGAATTESSGYCGDLWHFIVTGRDYPVQLQTAADDPAMAGPGFAEAGWLLSRSDELIAAAADARLEAAAIQVAVWQLTGQVREGGTPTGDAAVNARAGALRALAAGRRLPSALAVAVGGPPTCLGQAAAVTVTGTPGAQVDLAVTAGEGTVTPARVTIGEDGTASAKLRAESAGDVTVDATTTAPLLVRATKLPGADAPQDQLMLQPGTLTARATHRFQACDLFALAPTPRRGDLAPAGEAPPAPGPGAPAAPAAPGTAPAGRPAVEPIALTMRAPKVAAPGGTVVYRIRVANRGRATARDLEVAQRLGRGLVALRARGPKGTRASARGGAARWRLAALAPGRSATLRLTVRVGRALAGDVGRARVTARAAGARAARADGATAVVRRVGKTEQGF